jgi:hypothetical protein
MRFAVGLIAIGLGTYFVGICVFGPRQKYKTMKIVIKLMISNPEEFKSEKVRGETVGPSTPIEPRSSVKKTFDGLPIDEDGMKAFQAGLHNYGLQEHWDAAKAKNSKNCVELKHGIPFLRLARFGFFSAPGPADLGGILNANALYSLCTGLSQLAFGSYIAHKHGVDALSLLPLTISFISLVLSAFNVLFDFSGILSEIDSEHRKIDDFKRRSQEGLNKSKEKEAQKRDNKMKELDKKFERRDDALGIFEKGREIDSANQFYGMQVERVHGQNEYELKQELTLYRKRIRAIKKVIKGEIQVTSLEGVDETENIRKDTLMFQRLVEQVQGHAREELESLPICEMSAEEYKQASEKIRAEASQKIKILEEGRKEMLGRWNQTTTDEKSIEQVEDHSRPDMEATPVAVTVE